MAKTKKGFKNAKRSDKFVEPRVFHYSSKGEVKRTARKVGTIPKERASIDQVKRWFSDPSLNIGVVTGSVSNIAVLDLDGPEGIAWLSANQDKARGCLVSITGRGQQLWFQTSTKVPTNSVCKIHTGVDVRGEGGYVVAPPSTHPNGRRYRFTSALVGPGALPTFPMDLIAIPAPTSSEVFGRRKEDGWIGKALREMKVGNIDDTLFSICGKLRADGYSPVDALELLRLPAISAGAIEGHLEEKIANAWKRYEPRKSVSISRSGAGGLQPLTIHAPQRPESVSEYNASLSRIAGIRYPTGYARMDALTGGLQRGEILTVAARTGIGKTNWLIGPARTFCRRGLKVLYFSTEMSFDQIWGRYINTLARPDEFEGHQFHICDEFTPSPERIETALTQVQPDLMIFDHINHVAEDHQALAEFMKACKFMARKFNIPAILAAQLNRSADWIQNGERVEPRLSMIKGSGAIEEVSGQVLLLTEKRINPEYNEILGVVDKNRWGDKGVLGFGLFKNPWRVEELPIAEGRHE